MEMPFVNNRKGKLPDRVLAYLALGALQGTESWGRDENMVTGPWGSMGVGPVTGQGTFPFLS